MNEYLRRVGPPLDMRESKELRERVRVASLAALVDLEPRDDGEWMGSNAARRSGLGPRDVEVES